MPLKKQFCLFVSIIRLDHPDQCPAIETLDAWPLRRGVGCWGENYSENINLAQSGNILSPSLVIQIHQDVPTDVLQFVKSQEFDYIKIM